MKIPTWLPYSVAAAGLAVLSGATVYALLPDASPLCRGWVDPSAPAQIQALAKPVERITNMKGLGKFLSGVAWIESRGNARAGSDSGNSARGWFGMRPNSARVADVGLSPDAIKDGATAVALAAWYIHRLLPFASPGQKIDWLAIRRGWGYPVDLPKVDHPGYKDQLATGLRCAGIDPNFMFDTAIRSSYTWPGIDAVLDVVGRGRNA